MKKLFALVIVLACCAAVNAAYEWKNVQILGGGYVPGVAFHPSANGPVYIRTDVGGAYRLNADRETWTPLNDMFDSGNDMGSIAIGLDPDDPDVVYVTGGLYLDVSWCSQGSVFKSTDRGASWTRFPLNPSTVSGTDPSVVAKEWDGTPSHLCLGGNGVNRGTGNRLAVKGDTVYLGTDQNGLLRSTNGGTSWTTVAPTQFSNTSGVSAVLFDKDGNVFAAPFAGGLFRSADGGSWTRIIGGSAIEFNDVIYQMSYSPAGNVIWLTTNTTKPLDQSEPGGGKVYKYDIASNTLTLVTMPEKGGKNYGYIGISVNPNNANQILVSTGGWWKGTGSSPLDGSDFVSHEAIFMSTDGGATWRDIIANGTFSTAEAFNAATNNPHWLSALAVDPNDPDHVIFGTGYGVWSTTNATAAAPAWKFISKGIEETVALSLVSTTYGAPLVSILGDIDGFYHAKLDEPPAARHKLEDGTSEAGTNYSSDYAGLHPNYVVRIHKEARAPLHLGAYSEDGGKTWKNFKSRPPFVPNQYGNNPDYSGEDNFVAVSADASAIVWNMKQHGVYISTDHGATWTASSTSASLLEGFRPVADKVKPGTFYLYNAGSGVVYKSENNGASWAQASSGHAAVDDWAYDMIRIYASPYQEGELWMTQGAALAGIFYAGTGGMKRSTDGGATFTAVSGLTFVKSIGFGKSATADGPPAVYAVAYNSPTNQGVFRSDNNGGTWTRITGNNLYGGITMVIGDPCVYSRVYLGTEGRGIIYGQDPAVMGTNDCENRIDSPNHTSIGYNRAPGAAAIRKPALVRQGNILRSDAPIYLYNLRGKKVAVSSMQAGGVATLNMSRLPGGVYIAKSGTQTIRVRLQR